MDRCNLHRSTSSYSTLMYFVHPGSEASALVLGGQLRMLNRQPFALLEPGKLIPKLQLLSCWVNLCQSKTRGYPSLLG